MLSPRPNRLQVYISPMDRFFVLATAALLALVACNSSDTATGPALTPVALHGQLRVEGTQLLDACGRPVQLSGVSHFWHTWEGQEHWNGDVVAWLRDDWRVSVLRAPLACHPNVEGDYLTAPDSSMAQLRRLVDGAIREGMYIIVDFHAHNAYPEEAKEVLGTIAQEYGQYPNLLYAIWNEPVGTQEAPEEMWTEIKAFAKTVIPVIRAADTNNVIVVPTPFYDQFPDVAAANPLTSADLGIPADNLMYDVHAYAGQHKKMIRDRADVALAAGLPIIMTEVGRVGVDWGPQNKIDSVSFGEWMTWIDAHQISFTKWSLSYRDEVSSSLLPTASATGAWTEADLSPEGRFNRAFLRQRGERFYQQTACEALRDGQQ